MRTQKTLTAITLACTLLWGVPGAAAQDRGAERKGQVERQQREVIVMGQEPGALTRLPLEPGLLPAPVRGDTFTFVSTEMSFDNKVVKGAPYSAEAVTESVQTLADGNRIVRKNSSQVYRDGEGRTRREFTLSVLGPWASTEDAPRTISINDPVAKVSYTLDPRTRTARKVSPAPFGADGNVTFNLRAPGPAPADGKPVEFKRIEVNQLEGKALGEAKSPLSGRLLKSVEAVYPEKAKAAGAKGMVAVKIKVNQAGVVESAEALIGDQPLRESALQAARQWSFKPGEAETGAISFTFDAKKATAAGELVRIFEFKKGDADNAALLLGGLKAPNVQTESLGKQFIEGVEAEGTRTVRTIPAGEIGNEQPIQVVSERWYSPELQVVVMTRQSDPRVGETTYRLTNIVRGEPAASLFQVPADYTVKDSMFIRTPGPGRRLLPAGEN